MDRISVNYVVYILETKLGVFMLISNISIDFNRVIVDLHYYKW